MKRKDQISTRWRVILKDDNNSKKKKNSTTSDGKRG